MNTSLSDLLQILEAEAELYRGLLDVMQRERDAMVRLQRNEMETAAAQKETLIQQLLAVEDKRLEQVLRLADRLGCRPGELTLTLLAQTSPEDRQTDLRRCRQTLLGLVARMREETGRSNALCRHISELLQALYGAAKGMAAGGPVYRRGGRLDEMRLNGRLIRNEI